VEYSRLVYSTGRGRVRNDDGRPKPSSPQRGPQVPNDGVVRVFRDRGGRKGKTVTLVTGVPAAARADVAARLKRALGTGGGVHEEVIEIQGDHRDLVAARLGELGYRVKLAGG
jgi:translation initiation factor 1